MIMMMMTTTTTMEEAEIYAHNLLLPFASSSSNHKKVYQKSLERKICILKHGMPWERNKKNFVLAGRKQEEGEGLHLEVAACCLLLKKRWWITWNGFSFMKCKVQFKSLETVIVVRVMLCLCVCVCVW